MNKQRFSKSTSNRKWSAILIAIGIILVIQASTAAADVFYVGDGVGCTATDIGTVLLAAVFSAGPDEIRVARNRTHLSQWIHLTDWSPSGVGALIIVGGYDSCTDSTPSGRTTLVGRSGLPIFHVDTSSATSVVTLRNLTIQGIIGGEEGVLVEGDSTVSIENCIVESNQGGGVAAKSGADVTIDYFSTVRNNNHFFGGGVYCNDAAVSISGIVSGNMVTSSGGGIFAGFQCDMALDPGALIQSNTANWGGGIYATDGATVVIDGRSTLDGAQVQWNTANNQGGGIFANGSGTQATVHNGWVNNNTATTDGGGIYVANGAVVSTARLAGACLDAQRCTQVSHNRLTTAGNGAAVFVETGGIASINQTFVEGNSGPGNTGFLMFATGTGSVLFLQGVQIWGNGAVSLFQGEDAAVIRAAFVSTARNVNISSGHSRLMQLNSNATTELNSSIFWDTDGIAIGTGAAISEADCIITNDTVGLMGVATFLDTSNPLFKSPDIGDLGLRAESPAVDYCDDFFYTPSLSDIHREVRGYDLAESTNGSPGPGSGVFDLGADEIYYFFYDGFESGDVSEWSSSAL